VPEPLLVAHDVAKAYGDLVALEPLSLSVEPGEVVALVGHNGSGKSTFLRLAAGLLDATDGWIEIACEPAGSTVACATTSFVPDDPVLYDDLSVREHLTYVAALYGEPPGEDDQETLLDRLGLTHRADDLPARFSRGLRQKASIALGLIRPFRLLLVDEPFVGLDSSGRAAMLELLDDAREHEAAVVVATHDPSFVERATRCVALRDGRLVHDGAATPEEVVALTAT
jgi:ABC-2 type transport system ATP-binding protein